MADAGSASRVRLAEHRRSMVAGVLVAGARSRSLEQEQHRPGAEQGDQVTTEVNCRVPIDGRSLMNCLGLPCGPRLTITTVDTRRARPGNPVAHRRARGSGLAFLNIVDPRGRPVAARPPASARHCRGWAGQTSGAAAHPQRYRSTGLPSGVAHASAFISTPPRAQEQASHSGQPAGSAPARTV